jgi:acetyl-CoA C-acetyltransferase
MSDDTTPVILGGARTPFGKFRGALSSLPAPELGALAIRAALERAGIPPEAVEALLMGQVVQAGSGQGPARQAGVGAGLPWHVPATTINKICLSGLTAVIDAARLVRTGEAQVVVAGGQESMSNAPHALLGSRLGLPYGDATLVDTLVDGLTDPFSGTSMGCSPRPTTRPLRSRGGRRTPSPLGRISWLLATAPTFMLRSCLCR